MDSVCLIQLIPGWRKVESAPLCPARTWDALPTTPNPALPRMVQQNFVISVLCEFDVVPMRKVVVSVCVSACVSLCVCVSK